MSEDEDKELDDLLNSLNQEPVLETRSYSINQVEEPAPVVTTPAEPDVGQIFTEQLKKLASQYGEVFEEIITTYKKDREQAQEVIDQFMNVIASGGKVPRVYLEKIADAVRAKNEIAQTAIRALDSLPKLISSTKGNDMFTNNIGISFDSAHLKEILEAAEDDK